MRRLVPVVVLALIGVGSAAFLSSNQERGDAQAVPNLKYLEGLKQVGAELGERSAPVTVTVLVDLNQPESKRVVESVLPQLVSRLVRPGKARLALWVWPVIGQNAVLSAQAATAAQQQNRIWQFARVATANQGAVDAEWWTDAVAARVAKSSGLDIARFKSDVTSSTVTAVLSRNVQVATSIGAKLPPAFALESPGGDRKLLPGRSTVQEIVAAVTAAS